MLSIENGGAVEMLMPASGGELVAQLMFCVVYCAVDCFVMVTGFVYNRARYRYSNFVVLWLQAAFWSLVLTLVAAAFGDYPLEVRGVARALMPVTYNTWWFFQVYALLFLLIPVLNGAINSFSKRQAGVLVLTLLMACSALPELMDKDIARTGFGVDALWFSCLYLTGAYVSRWSRVLTGWERGCALLIVVVFIALLWGSCQLAAWGVDAGYSWMRRFNLLTYSSPLVVVIAVGFLLVFKDTTCGARLSRLVDWVAPCSFGVYLIHEFWWVQSLYAGRLGFLASASVLRVFIGVLGFSLCVFIVCLGLDLLRSLLFKCMKVAERLKSLETRLLGDVWADD